MFVAVVLDDDPTLVSVYQAFVGECFQSDDVLFLLVQELDEIVVDFVGDGAVLENEEDNEGYEQIYDGGGGNEQLDVVSLVSFGIPLSNVEQWNLKDQYLKSDITQLERKTQEDRRAKHLTPEPKLGIKLLDNQEQFHNVFE